MFESRNVKPNTFLSENMCIYMRYGCIYLIIVYVSYRFIILCYANVRHISGCTLASFVSIFLSVYFCITYSRATEALPIRGFPFFPFVLTSAVENYSPPYYNSLLVYFQHTLRLRRILSPFQNS